jgi:CBS domain-containing protein
MTANPDCATLDTTILDALHIMHDGKFLHIPVIDGGLIFLWAVKYLTCTVYICHKSQVFIFVNRWTNCCLPGRPSTYPCNYSTGDPS